MADFQLLNRNRFYLPGAEGEFLHLASVARGVREYVCFYQRQGHKLYLEEISSGQLHTIKEESIWRDLYFFLIHKGALKEPFIEDNPNVKSFKIPALLPYQRIKAASKGR